MALYDTFIAGEALDQYIIITPYSGTANSTTCLVKAATGGAVFPLGVTQTTAGATAPVSACTFGFTWVKAANAISNGATFEAHTNGQAIAASITTGYTCGVVMRASTVTASIAWCFFNPMRVAAS